MPLPCHFTVSKEKLAHFRNCLEATSSSPPSWFSTWKSCWERVSDTLDQAEARAVEKGDVEFAKQIVRLNRLIEWCLKPDWDCLSQEGGAVEKTFRCAVHDWADAWSRFKLGLGRAHIEVFQDSLADLQRLQDCLTVLPEASWAHVAQKQVQHLVDDVVQVLRAPYEETQ